jgi:transcriptional regulator with XRE-family HTH domain
MNNRLENIHGKTNVESTGRSPTFEIAMTMPMWDSAALIVLNARKAKGLSQADFGEMIERGQSLVSKYERSLVEPPGSVVMKCMNILCEGPVTGRVASSTEVASLVAIRLAAPQFSKLRTALVDLIESVSVAPGDRDPSEA